MKRMGAIAAALLPGLLLVPAPTAAAPERVNRYYIAKDAGSNAMVSLRIRDEALVRGFLAERIRCDSRDGTAHKQVNFVVSFGPSPLDDDRFHDRRDLGRAGISVLAGHRTGEREFSGRGRVDALFSAGKRGPFTCESKIDYRAAQVTYRKYLAYNERFGVSPNDP